MKNKVTNIKKWIEDEMLNHLVYLQECSAHDLFDEEDLEEVYKYMESIKIKVQE